MQDADGYYWTLLQGKLKSTAEWAGLPSLPVLGYQAMIGQQNRHFRVTDKTTAKNTVPARYFWTTAKALFIEENGAQKFGLLLGYPTLLLLVYFVALFFFVGFISRLHCFGLL